jgi:hypothetical protein
MSNVSRQAPAQQPWCWPRPHTSPGSGSARRLPSPPARPPRRTGCPRPHPGVCGPSAPGARWSRNEFPRDPVGYVVRGSGQLPRRLLLVPTPALPCSRGLGLLHPHFNGRRNERSWAPVSRMARRSGVRCPIANPRPDEAERDGAGPCTWSLGRDQSARQPELRAI